MRNLKDGEYSYWASCGKKLLKLMNPSQKQQILSLVDHASHGGELEILECWKIDKTKSHLFKKDGSNIFSVAKKVAVPKRKKIALDFQNN